MDDKAHVCLIDALMMSPAHISQQPQSLLMAALCKCPAKQRNYAQMDKGSTFRAHHAKGDGGHHHLRGWAHSALAIPALNMMLNVSACPSSHHHHGHRHGSVNLQSRWTRCCCASTTSPGHECRTDSCMEALSRASTGELACMHARRSTVRMMRLARACTAPRRQRFCTEMRCAGVIPAW